MPVFHFQTVCALVEHMVWFIDFRGDTLTWTIGGLTELHGAFVKLEH